MPINATQSEAMMILLMSFATARFSFSLLVIPSHSMLIISWACCFLTWVDKSPLLIASLSGSKEMVQANKRDINRLS